MILPIISVAHTGKPDIARQGIEPCMYGVLYTLMCIREWFQFYILPFPLTNNHTSKNTHVISFHLLPLVYSFPSDKQLIRTIAGALLEMVGIEPTSRKFLFRVFSRSTPFSSP